MNLTLLKHTTTNCMKTRMEGFSAVVEPEIYPKRIGLRTEFFSVDAIIIMKVAFIGLYIYKTT